MSKARVYGMLSGYTPNSKMDMRHQKKTYQRQRGIVERAEQRAAEATERKDIKSKMEV